MKRFLILGSALALSQAAQAATVLPMLYLPDSTTLKRPSPSSELLLGASPFMDTDGKISIKASNTIYVAPQKASVQASKAHVYATANCGVVNLAIEDEKSMAQLFHDTTELLQSYGEEVKTYSSESKSARSACLAARKAKSPDEADLCDYSAEVSSLLKDLTGELSAWTQQVVDASDAFSKRYESLGAQAGGYTVATVQLWDAQDIAAVKVANPSYDVALVPFKKVNFTFTTAEDGIPASSSVKTVLGFSLAGQSSVDGAASDAARAQVLTGSNISLGVTLSRFGACDSSLVRAATFHYDYDAFAFVHGTAMINKWQAYERIEKTKSKGGFFTTSSVHSLYEDLKAGSIHSVLVEGVPDGDFALATEQLSAAILDDLLRELGDPSSVPANPVAVLGLPTPSANGASVVADGLSQCPNIYCQVGAWTLKSLSAIFGGQTSTDQIKAAYDKKVRREYAYTSRLDAHGSSSTLVDWRLDEAGE